MKKLLIVSTMFALAAASAQAQGFIKFSNTSTTRVSTNMVVGGSITAPTAPVSTGLIYNYALYVSTTATAVNGQSTPIVGAASLNYAFNDTNWTLVAYGSNALQSGQFAGTPSSTVSVFGRCLMWLPGAICRHRMACECRHKHYFAQKLV